MIAIVQANFARGSGSSVARLGSTEDDPDA
jgi:hypothetical protein